MKFRGICRGSCILTEAMTVDMDVDGKTITAKVYIADNDLFQEDFLLGQDVIISAHLEINFESADSKIKRAVHQPTNKIFRATKKVSRCADYWRTSPMFSPQDWKA